MFVFSYSPLLKSLEIITREGLCNNSTSPFTTSEINFMRAIDRAKGLSINHLYSAQYPIGLTEILHWRTLSELMNFCNMRGAISSDTISMKPLRFVDGYCNISEIYRMNNYQGPLSQLPNLRMAPAFAFLYIRYDEIHMPVSITNGHSVSQSPCILPTVSVDPSRVSQPCS